jgi:hypothetical protein
MPETSLGFEWESQYDYSDIYSPAPIQATTASPAPEDVPAILDSLTRVAARTRAGAGVVVDEDVLAQATPAGRGALLEIVTAPLVMPGRERVALSSDLVRAALGGSHSWEETERKLGYEKGTLMGGGRKLLIEVHPPALVTGKRVADGLSVPGGFTRGGGAAKGFVSLAAILKLIVYSGRSSRAINNATITAVKTKGPSR